MRRRLLAATVWLLAAGAGVPSGWAQTQSLAVTYFSVPNTAVDPDFQPAAGYPSTAPSSSVVDTPLGTDWLPVRSAAYAPSGTCPSTTTYCIHDVNVSNEITWWSPSLNSHVTQTGTGTISLTYNSGSNSYDYSDTTMYPSNAAGANDTSSFLTASYRGILYVPTAETVSFSIGADDSAFLYVDRVNVASIGGIHGPTSTTYTTSVLSVGYHYLNLYYADLNTTGAVLNLSLTTSNATITAPEPSALSMFAVGTLGLAGYQIRRRNRRHSQV